LKRIDCEPRLEKIRCPMLFLTGDKDPSAPPDLVRGWQSRVPGARLAIIDNAAHITNIEQPAAFDAALAAFFKALPGEQR
jgi:pimeloyl-ACP methyl ester carboxylesterase